MITRRNLFLQIIGGGSFALAFNFKSVYAKNKPRADKVLWGGLGYSVKQKEIEIRLPYVSKAIDSVGYKNIVSGFTNLL